jgi:hypothetical protein
MRTIFTSLVVLLTAGGVACGARPSESVGESSTENALRALASNEILGSIGYGETRSPIAYTATPRYRAYTFSGAAGDAITIDVRSLSVGGDPAVWLLAADNSNLAAVHGGHIAATLPQTASYTIALRDFNLEDATFSVSLAGPPSDPDPDPNGEGDLDAGSPPPPSGNPFDDSSCSGAAITQTEALRHFATSASISNPLGAGYAVYSRIQTCTTLTGCGAWSATTAWPQIMVRLRSRTALRAEGRRPRLHRVHAGHADEPLLPPVDERDHPRLAGRAAFPERAGRSVRHVLTKKTGVFCRG